MAISLGHDGDGKRASMFTEINITPLTDIFLVLLIIMMVIAPMFQNSHAGIKVPSIKTGEAVNENKVTAEITKDGHFFINSKATPEAELTPALKAVIVQSADKMVTVRADKQTPSSEVLKVFNAASAAGFQRLTIAGQPLSGTRSAELEKTAK